MRVVDINKLKNVTNTKESGNYTKLFTAEFDKKLYAYLVFKELQYDNWMIENIGDLTEETFSEEFLSPLYLVGKSNKFRFNGILCNYEKDASDLGFIRDRYKLLKYLKQSKEVLLKLHNEFKYIHGDVSASNLIVDQTEDKVYMCDMVTATKIGKTPKSYWYLSMDLDAYLKYYGFNKGLDIYKFNLMTLAVLTDKYEQEVFELIENDKIDFLSDNKDIKKLAKELLFCDTRKPYSGEFIIDYF